MTKIELMKWVKNCEDEDEIIVITDYDHVKITGIDTSEEGQIVIQCESMTACDTCDNYSGNKCDLGYQCLNGSEWCPKTE